MARDASVQPVTNPLGILIELFARQFRYEPVPERNLAVLDDGESRRRDVICTMLRDEDEVGMRHAETVHDQANPNWGEFILEDATDRRRDLGEVSKEFRRMSMK